MLRQRTAVDSDHFEVSAITRRMNCSGHDLLTGPSLAGNQDCAATRSHKGDDVCNILELLTFSNEELAPKRSFRAHGMGGVATALRVCRCVQRARRRAFVVKNVICAKLC